MGNPNPTPPVQPDSLSERFAVQAEINQSLKRINALQDKATLVRSPESPAANAIRRAKRPVGKNETFYQRRQRVDALFTSAISSEDIYEFIQALLRKAKNGDLDAIRIILDRLAGKPQTAIDLTSGGERMGDTTVELILDVSQGPGMQSVAEGEPTRVLPLESGNADTAKSNTTAVAAIAPSAK